MTVTNALCLHVRQPQADDMISGSFNAACVLVILVISATALGLSIAALHATTHQQQHNDIAPTPAPTNAPVFVYEASIICGSGFPVYFGERMMLMYGNFQFVGSRIPIASQLISYNLSGATPSSGSTYTDATGYFSVYGTPNAPVGGAVTVGFQVPVNAYGDMEVAECPPRVVAQPSGISYYSYKTQQTGLKIVKNTSTPVIGGTAFKNGSDMRVGGLKIGYALSSTAGCAAAPTLFAETNSTGQFMISVVCANAGTLRVVLSFPDDSTLTKLTTKVESFILS